MKREVIPVIALLVLTACGGDSTPATTATTVATTATTRAPTTTLPPTTVIAPTQGLPEKFPPELVPPGVTSVYWEPTGAGTDVFFETSAGFEEIIDFFTDALEPPLDVRTEEGVDRAIWVYKPGVENISVIVESDSEGVHLKVSGLF
ncbi:MAG: hypothetical protein OXS29_08650 [bacterium]|nr:hypothetical protein [bacterium]MDE0290519.1 hypothetical protein [bacterium]MDE0436917.1 hypothetical protein [bacterium]